MPNEGSGTVSVIDTATDKVTATLNFGKKPRGIAISADGTRLYLSDQTANALVVVDIAKRRDDRDACRSAIRRRRSTCRPTASGSSAAIEENDQVVIVDTAALKVDRSIKMKGKNPEHAVFSPDGKWLYVSAEEADSVDIVDVAKGEVVKSVKVGDRPRGIGFLPDGTRAYVAAENADTVNVFDTATHDVIARIKAGSRSQRRPGPSGRQARVRDVGRQGNGAGDRHGDQRDRRRDPGRQAAVEHGAHAGRQEALRRLRPLQCSRRRRHRHLHQDRGDPGRRAALGRGDPLIARRAMPALLAGARSSCRVRVRPSRAAHPSRLRPSTVDRHDTAARASARRSEQVPSNVQVFGARDLARQRTRRCRGVSRTCNANSVGVEFAERAIRSSRI